MTITAVHGARDLTPVAPVLHHVGCASGFRREGVTIFQARRRSTDSSECRYLKHTPRRSDSCRTARVWPIMRCTRLVETSRSCARAGCKSAPDCRVGRQADSTFDMQPRIMMASAFLLSDRVSIGSVVRDVW